MPDLPSILRLIRIRQWIKNVIVLFPAFFDLRLFQFQSLRSVALAFLATSLCASAVYAFNDFFDRAEDALHPVKCTRPLASGHCPARFAVELALLLMTLGLLAGWYLNVQVLICLLGYIVLNISYTLFLKHISIVDVFAVAANYMLRVTIGAVACGITNSPWLNLATLLFALFIALAKRRDDVMIFNRDGSRTRRIVDHYNLEFLNASIVMMATVLIVCYIMYAMSAFSTAKYHTDKLYLTTVFVVMGVTRYLQVVFVEQKSGSPTEIALTDRFTQVAVAGWVVCFAGLTYGHQLLANLHGAAR